MCHQGGRTILKISNLFNREPTLHTSFINCQSRSSSRNPALMPHSIIVVRSFSIDTMSPFFKTKKKSYNIRKVFFWKVLLYPWIFSWKLLSYPGLSIGSHFTLLSELSKTGAIYLSVLWGISWITRCGEILITSWKKY